MFSSGKKNRNPKKYIMIVSLQVRQSNKPPVVVRTDKRLESFKTRHAVSLNGNFLPLKSPSLSTFQHPQAAQLVVAKHTQSFRCNSSHSFVSGRKVSHFEECAIFLHLNGNNKTLMKRIIIQILNFFFFFFLHFTHSNNCLQKSAYSG